MEPYFWGNHERLSETACTGRRFDGFGVPSAARRVRPYRICLRRRVCAFVPARPCRQRQPLSEQADAAWKAGNYAEAERLYNVVARDAALPTDQRALAWERVARAALSSGNMQGAQNALKFWKDLVPGAENSSAWLDVQSKLSGAGGAGQPSFSSGCVALALPLSRSVRAVRQPRSLRVPRPRRVNCPSPA